ncbi:hypothetical protein MPDQ_004594 [Monascus purpureus]|uniref:N-acetyltransferase domain-containing protein n=1 Tax=Monascus purpureus TaxID=5098 RepID=A0A507R6A1_MONPU|nr:hypothetical protein MPDQ_004594 [Monascus purpureus]BDD61581.1 hypothetical protein MAP00_006622 [Monascus purpureus]
MAYQFFAKTQHSKTPAATSNHGAYNSRQNRPPTHPPPLVFPQSSLNPGLNRKPPTCGDSSFQPDPYPRSLSSGYPTPHPHVTVEPVNTAHIPSLTRITGLLLPIRYPNSFYTTTITDPVIASLSRVAIYHDHPVTAPPTPGSIAASKSSGTDKVIGGIRCRLERHPQFIEPRGKSNTRSRPEPTNLYIQTLHLLSPYRGNGVATSLLNSLLFSSPSPDSKASSGNSEVSDLVKHYNIRTVTAHVHEANEEGLNWYIARGFHVEDCVVEGYYRRLNPSGARIVKLTMQWEYEDGEESPAKIQKLCDDDSASQNGKSKYRNVVHDNQDDDDDDWEKVEVEDGES